MSRERFLETAASHLGYHGRPGNVSTFGGLVGYQGLPWDGSFIDVVARDAEVSLPACVYTPSGLAEFIFNRRWHAKPQPGDIVFFTWSTGDDFGMPHVGIVTDTSDWNRLGCFRSIEACVNSGLPKGGVVNDGVYLRLRWKFEVLGFGRPDFKLRPAKEIKKADGQVSIRLENIRPGKRHKDVERVQLALASITGLRNAKAGSFDGQTQAAYSRWQRSIGLVGKNTTGLPDFDSLSRLGRETGYFRIDS
jgi:hypothetical protein